MDFTPPSNSNPLPIPPIQASPISSIPCSSQKLPIKRKTPNSALILTNPNLEFPDHDDVITRNPPFKFHRIWTEPDEIRLLQSLLDYSSQGLSFPRDLGIFYAQFSHGILMSQPYSKSQLSEKLRRLRKKFRVISSRLSKGFDKSLLSPQDQALYHLSKQLWEPDHPSLPFSDTNCKPIHNNNNNNCKANFSLPAVLALPSVIKKTSNLDNSSKINNVDDINGNNGGDVELGGNGVRVKKDVGDELSNGIVHFATTTLADVVDRSLKEMRNVIDVKRFSDLEKEVSFEKRWRDQRVAEFDVLAKRLKLIVERCCSASASASMVGK